MLQGIPDILRSGAAFVVVLGVLVFVHEMGHYLAARWRGVHVEAFSIGFGRPIFSWTDSVGTIWKVCWLPLGGYVKLHGQEREEDISPEERALWQQGRTFHEKSVLSRAIVVAAGPIANFLLAMVLFTGLFMVAGRPVTLPEIGEVVANSAAAKAGMVAGDRIRSIGSPTLGTQDIGSFEDIQRIVSVHPGEQLTVRLLRGDKQIDLPVLTGTQPDGKTGMLGIRGGKIDFVPLGFAQSIVAGATQTWEVTAQTFSGVKQMLTGARGTEDLGGPLRIAQLSGQVAQLGIASLISFIAVLSVNLGLINLFPIPILDGGHLVFYALEALRGRPLPPRAQAAGYRAGLALLAGLFVFATWNDLSHFGIFRWVAGLIG